MKLLCSLLLLLLYLAVTGRSSDAQLLQQDDDVFHDDDVFQDDDVFLHHSRTDEVGLQLAAGTTSIDATWVEVPGASSYTISWTPGDNGGTATVKTGSNNYTYTITGLVPCTVYTVTVQAMNETDAGNYANDTTTTKTKDSLDLSLSAGTEDITARWDEVPGASSYTISWTPGDNGGTDTVDGGNNTKHNIKGLKPCTNYTVTVQAKNETGHVGCSDTGSRDTKTKAPDPPEVTAVMVVDESQQLSVSWTQPDAPGPQCPITRYNVTWCLASTNQLVDQNFTSDTNLTISNLEAWTNYTVCVAAATQQNDEQKYSESKCTLGETDQATPGPTSNTTIKSQTARSMLVVWGPPEEPRGIITIYSVTWSPPDTYDDSEATVDGSTTQYTITSLDPCVTYTVTVTAATCKGYGQRHDDQQVNGTTEIEAPPSPSVTCEEVVSPHQATVTWPPVTTKCTVSGYRVNYTGDVLWSDDTRHDSLQPLTTYADLSNLTPWTTYTVCVAGVVVNNIVGAWSCCYSTTLEAGAGRNGRIGLSSSAHIASFADRAPRWQCT